MPVGPLQLQTLNMGAVNTEAQTQAAPTFSKLRRALQNVSQVAANEDNPAKKREMLRAAMEGAGTGFSDTSLAAHNAALQTVGKNTDIANQGILATYGADVSREAQATSIEAQQGLQTTSLAAAKEAQRAGIASAERLAALNREAEIASQERAITANKESQALTLAQAREAQKAGIASSEGMQTKAILSSENQAALNRDYQTKALAQEKANSLGLSGFNAEISKANTLLAKPPAPPTYSYNGAFGLSKDRVQSPEQAWDNSYQRALQNYYASVGGR